MTCYVITLLLLMIPFGCKQQFLYALRIRVATYLVLHNLHISIHRTLYRHFIKQHLTVSSRWNNGKQT